MVDKKLYQARWYQNHREEHIAKIAPRRKLNQAENRRYLDELKSVTPCADCGKIFPPYVMDFDHLHSKFNNVSRMVSYSRNTLISEINKCEIVCANCHRMRTHNRAVNSNG